MHGERVGHLAEQGLDGQRGSKAASRPAEKLGTHSVPEWSKRSRRGAGKGVSNSSTASVSGSMRPMRSSLSWLNQIEPSGATSMPYGTGIVKPPPPPELRLRRSTCWSSHISAGISRSASSCCQVRAGRRTWRCSPVAGSNMPTWFEAAIVYQMRPFASKRSVCG
jgi:hypothetical protein